MSNMNIYCQFCLVVLKKLNNNHSCWINIQPGGCLLWLMNESLKKKSYSFWLRIRMKFIDMRLDILLALDQFRVQNLIHLVTCFRVELLSTLIWNSKEEVIAFNILMSIILVLKVLYDHKWAKVNNEESLRITWMFRI